MSLSVLGKCAAIENQVNVKRAAELAARWDRSRRALTLVNSNDTEIRELIEYTHILYGVIWDEAGQPIIIDSSKVPSHFQILRRIPAIDVRMLHLIRDGRAVAYSWDKRRKREAARTEVAYMPHHSPMRSIITWCYENMMMRYFGRNSRNYTVLRYEEMAQSPYDIIKDTLDQLGVEVNVPSDMSSSLATQPTHSVGGNPLRFNSVNRPIIVDTEWNEKMHLGTKLLLSFAAAPVLHSFGYPILI